MYTFESKSCRKQHTPSLKCQKILTGEKTSKRSLPNSSSIPSQQTTIQERPKKIESCRDRYAPSINLKLSRQLRPKTINFQRVPSNQHFKQYQYKVNPRNTNRKPKLKYTSSYHLKRVFLNNSITKTSPKKQPLCLFISTKHQSPHLSINKQTKINKHME